MEKKTFHYSATVIIKILNLIQNKYKLCSLFYFKFFSALYCGHIMSIRHTCPELCLHSSLRMRIFAFPKNQNPRISGQGVCVDADTRIFVFPKNQNPRMSARMRILASSRFPKIRISFFKRQIFSTSNFFVKFFQRPIFSTSNFFRQIFQTSNFSLNFFIDFSNFNLLLLNNIF